MSVTSVMCMAECIMRKGVTPSLPPLLLLHALALDCTTTAAASAGKCTSRVQTSGVERARACSAIGDAAAAGVAAPSCSASVAESEESAARGGARGRASSSECTGAASGIDLAAAASGLIYFETCGAPELLLLYNCF